MLRAGRDNFSPEGMSFHHWRWDKAFEIQWFMKDRTQVGRYETYNFKIWCIYQPSGHSFRRYNCEASWQKQAKRLLQAIAKYLLGCAVFCDLLAPCVILSKVMQHDHLDIFQVLTAVLRTVKETDKLSATELGKWPTYASIVEKCTEEEGEVVYQCQEL